MFPPPIRRRRSESETARDRNNDAVSWSDVRRQQSSTDRRTGPETASHYYSTANEAALPCEIRLNTCAMVTRLASTPMSWRRSRFSCGRRTSRGGYTFDCSGGGAREAHRLAVRLLAVDCQLFVRPPKVRLRGDDSTWAVTERSCFSLFERLASADNRSACTTDTW